MNSLQIEYFLALSKNMSFTDTAKALLVSQPAISKQIASLEKELGYSLFFRSNRTISLTPAGMAFLKLFNNFRDQYEHARNQVRDLYGSQSSTLRIGCVEGMEISSLLNKVFRSFSSQFPNIDFYLERRPPGELIKALYDGELDAVITLESFILNNSDLARSLLFETRHLLYFSANHPVLSKKAAFDYSDFKDETFLSVSPAVMPAAYKNIIEWSEKNGFTPKKIQYYPTVESLMLSVEVGLGVAIGDSLLRIHNSPLIRSIELNTSHSVFIVWRTDNINLLIPSFAKLAADINKPVAVDTSGNQSV
ncbi:MAG: LysR family transcriptional regulator [Clostridiales bacterium]|nr:LysR family transcriptional regulator [Clostridiales bacterium]